MFNKPIESNFDAFVMGLYLAVTAPSNKKSNQALELVEKLQSTLSKSEINKAKRIVEELLFKESEA